MVSLVVAAALCWVGDGFSRPAARVAARGGALRLNELPVENEFVEIDIGDGAGAPIRIETGRLGRQADAAVMTRRGGTMVYTTLCVGDDNENGGDFTPMSVEYFERFSATGRTSGAYNKRDGRQGEKEVLTSRLIDRPLRPTVVDGWSADIQLISWVVAYDGVHAPEVLAMVGSSAALQLSEVPTICSVGASHVSKQGEALAVDGPVEAQVNSTLSLYVASSDADDVLMVEAGAVFESDAVMFEALTLGQEAAARAARAVAAWAEALRAKGVGRPKNFDYVKPFPEALKEAIVASFGEEIRASTFALQTGDMRAHRRTLAALDRAVTKAFLTNSKEDYRPSDVKRALKKACEGCMASGVVRDAQRCDGRPTTEVRPIDVEVAFLPSAHGSAVFTRGETQALATCTLGDASMDLRQDDALSGADAKKFYVQYNFPPSSVGETGRVGAPGRREVGHGALAERALLPALPDAADFPYSVRVESLITESCGSSSMATVCGGCLSMMDAGVPLKTTVAGVAMGVIFADKNDDDTDVVVLTDILGVEDALGSMDFKVAGDATGVSAFQLDVKRRGLTLPILRDALEQARLGRLHILGKMTEAMPEGPRKALARNVPRQRRTQVPVGLIGKIIGPRGATIKAMIEDLGLSNLDIQEDGTVTVSAVTDEALEAAFARLDAMKADDEANGARRNGGRTKPPAYDGPMPEVNAVYQGTVESVKQFGIFVAFDEFPGLEGLCHISELAPDRVRNIERFIAKGERLEVKVLAVDDETKKLTLSRKAVIADKNKSYKANNNNNNNNNSNNAGAPAPPPPPTTTTTSSPP